MKNKSKHRHGNPTCAAPRAVPTWNFAVLTLLSALLAFGGQTAEAATVSLTNSVAGAFTWVAPSGATNVVIECWGAGGAGGGAASGSLKNGGGGAGGAYAKLTNYVVTGGTTYYFRVGAGAPRNNTGNTAVSGGDSWFSNASPAVVCLAKGGTSGASDTVANGGGRGGTNQSGSFGDVTFTGGDGFTNASNSGGGGGSSAGTDSNGNNATGIPGATAPTGGGKGGNGSGTAGQDGVTPGGGAGGGYAAGGTARNGGNGAAGQVVITYTVPFNTLDWIGDGSNNRWSTNSGNISWDSDANGTADSGFIDPDLVTFGAAGAANPTVTIETRVAPTSVTVNSDSDYTFTGSGKISGITSLAKSGVGNLTLGTANDYSGGTDIGSGRIRLGGNNFLGSGLVTLNGGTLSSDGATARTLTNVLSFANTASTFGDVTDNGTLTITGPVTLTGPSAKHLTNQSDVVFAGGFTTQAAANSSKQGPGTLTLKGSVNFGNLTFDAVQGTIILDGATATAGGRVAPNASSGNEARIVITNGATFTQTAAGAAANLRVGNSGTGANYFDLAGLYIMTNAGAGQGRITLQTVSASSEFNLLPNGDVTITSVTSEGSGSGLTYFNFNGGTIRAKVDNSAFFPASTVTEANVKAGGANIDTDTNSITIGQNLLDGGGGLVKTGTGTLELSGINTYTGLTTVSNGTLLVTGSLAASADVKNGGTLGGSGTISGSLTLASGAFATNTQGSPLTVAGALIANGNTLNVATPSALDVGDYVLMTYNTSGSSGSFNVTPNISGFGLAANTTGTIVTGGGTVTLHVETGTANTPTNITYTATGTTLTLSWPSTHLGWFAQSNSVNLADTNFWFNIPGSESGTNLLININPAQSNVFYRLRNP